MKPGKKFFRFFVATGILCAVPLLFPFTASADSAATLSDARIKEILNQFSLERNSPVSNILRQIGWSIVLFLHWLVGGLEQVIYGINGAIGGFFTSDAVQKLEREKIIPIAVMLIAVVVLFIGIRSIIKPQQFTTITSNFIVGVTVAIALPTLLSAGYNFTSQAIDFLNSGSDGKSLTMSDRVLIDNITDNTQYDANGFQSKNLKYKSSYIKPGADASQISKIDASELINPDSMEYPDVWKNKLVTDGQGNQSLSGLNSGQVAFINIPMMSEYYYRWNIDWFNILVTLIITAVALLFSGVKIARLIYELTLHQVMAQVLGLLDVFTAQRLKKCIQSIVSTLGTLFAIFFMFQVYILGTAYISKIDNLFLRFILMIALAWSVIDGPDLFEQIFGIDAGLHGALRTVYGLKAAGNVVAGGIALAGGRGLMDSLKAKGVIGTAKITAEKAGSAIGGMGGFAAGMASGAMDNHRRYAAVRDKFPGKDSGKPQKRSESNVPGSPQKQKNPIPPSDAQPVMESPAQDKPPVSETIPQSEPGAASISEPVMQASAERSTQSANETVPPTSQDSEKRPSAENQPSTTASAMTLGGILRTNMARRLNQSGAVRTARRAYSLTRSSRAEHGNKQVALQERTLPKEQSGLKHRQAIKEAKREIRQEKSIRKDEMKNHDVPDSKATQRRV